MIGRINFYDEFKKYGFISSEELDRNVYFRDETLEKYGVNPDQLKSGVEVEFEYFSNTKGYIATTIKLV